MIICAYIFISFSTFIFVAALPCVVLRTRKSLFWRYQLGKPDSYLATIEAIYDAVVNLEERRLEDGGNYDGRYDDLLFFFRYFYDKMNLLYFDKSKPTPDMVPS